MAFLDQPAGSYRLTNTGITAVRAASPQGAAAMVRIGIAGIGFMVTV
jgi:hypothetical protein